MSIYRVVITRCEIFEVEADDSSDAVTIAFEPEPNDSILSQEEQTLSHTVELLEE